MPFSGASSSSSLVALYVLFALAGGPSPAQARPNPHAFLAKEGGCGRCHAAVPVRSGGGFVKDIVSLCQECHFQVKMSHPVDIRPRWPDTIPLPLDGMGAITCATCHDPHGNPGAAVPYVQAGVIDRMKVFFISGQDYPTFFLRLRNDKGQLCSLCHDLKNLERTEMEVAEDLYLDYTGSETCGDCHQNQYQAWKGTLHARTLWDPRKSRSVRDAEFTVEGVQLLPQEAVLAIGRHWTQRFLVDRGGNLMVSKEVWSILEQKWTKPYWKDQPWDRLCAGCHLTGYNPYSGKYEEAGIGCEACHGPGGKHAGSDGKGPIVNPARLGRDAADLICASCHTHGHDRTGEYRFPVGWVPGRDLGKYFLGLIPKPGQDEKTFKGDNTIADRLRSFRYWIDRYLMRKGVTCVLCKSFRAEDREEEADDSKSEFMNPAELCLSCHVSLLRGDARHSVFRLEESQCYRCHPPLTDRQGNPSIHDHKFIFARR